MDKGKILADIGVSMADFEREALEGDWANNVSRLWDSVDLVYYTQTWGHSTLAFRGVGTNSLTKAVTCIFHRGNWYMVYVGGRFAYEIRLDPNSNEGVGADLFVEDFWNRHTYSVDIAQSRYGLNVHRTCFDERDA